MHDPAALMRRLRDEALRVTAEDLDIAPSERRPRVWGAIMELGYVTGIATLMALSEGTTSLYWSGGGGVIGAEDEAVRRSADAFLDVVQDHLQLFSPVADTPRPRIGRVRLYVKTFDGTLGVDAAEEDLSGDAHPLAAVFHAGHAVLTAMREREGA